MIVQKGLADALLGIGLREEAATAYDERLRNHPEYIDAWIGASACYMEMDRLEKSASVAREAIAFAPKVVAVRRQLPHVLIRGGQHELAESEIEVAEQLGCEEFEISMDRGFLDHKRQDFRPTREHYTRAAQLRPASAAPHHGLAWVSIGETDYESARAALRKALDLGPSCPDALLAAARIEDLLGIRRAAAAVFEGLVEICQYDRSLHVDLGRQYMKGGNLAAWMETIVRAAKNVGS
jgi:tetratricopeptide (TPR) repeat protein